MRELLREIVWIGNSRALDAAQRWAIVCRVRGFNGAESAQLRDGGST
jgi:hypothetical protein